MHEIKLIKIIKTSKVNMNTIMDVQASAAGLALPNNVTSMILAHRALVRC